MKKKHNVCPVKLKPHQKSHVSNIWKSIVREHRFSYIDVSTTGLGKTHAALTIAWYLQRKYGMKVIIVASSHQSLYSSDSWNSWATQYEVEVEFMKTYSQLRQHNGKTSHPWLFYDVFNDTYSATVAFETLAQSGVFLIFDEFHKTTRDSDTHKAASALIRSCHRNRNRCRVGLLSFTPGDMPEHYPQILKMLGVIRKRKISQYNRSTRSHNLGDYGFGELIKYCVKIKPDFDIGKYLTEKPTVKRILAAAKDMYRDVIHPHITFAMPKPPQTVTVTRLNMFLETEKEDLEVINKGIELLKASVRWRNGAVGDGEWDVGGVFVGLRVIEQGKLNLFARYVHTQSRIHPTKKFIIAVGSKSLQHQDYLQQVLSKRYIPDKMYFALRLALIHSPLWRNNINRDVFDIICGHLANVIEPVKPVIMNGKTPDHIRTDIIDKFQSPTNDIWCLIMSPGVGGESISLHDKHGNHPRDIVISPNHFHTQATQTAGRIDRVDVKSACKIVMLYSKEANLETSILNAMVRKSKIAKELLTKEQKDEKFPAEYNYFIEGAIDLELVQKLDELKRQ